MEKLAKPHPHLGSMPLVGQAGGHGCKRHGAPWLKILCQLLAQAKQCEPLVLKDSGPSARQPGWASERDRNTSPRGAEGTAARSSSLGLGSPGPGSCQKLGMGSSWRLGWCRAQACGSSRWWPGHPRTSLYPGKHTCQTLGKAAGRKVLSSPLCACHSQRRKQRGFRECPGVLNAEEWTVLWHRTSSKANLVPTLFPQQPSNS